MEIRDLYDENKQLTGETVKKGNPIPMGKYYLTVVVWIQNSKGDFLLQRTVPEKYHMWATTGGHPKSGETSLMGIITEIKEELGIEVNENDLKLFKTIKTDDDFVDIYYLKMDLNITDITIQPEEVEDVMWASKEKIQEFIDAGIFLPPHIEFYNDCLKYIENN